MKKSTSIKDYMYSRAKVGAPKGNLGGEPDTKYPASEIKSKKIQTQPVQSSQPKKDVVIRDTKDVIERRAALDKKLRRKSALKNVRDWAIGTAATGAGLVAGYYGLTRKPTEKETKSAGREYRRWRWEK